MGADSRYKTGKKQIFIVAILAVLFICTAFSFGDTLNPDRFISPDTCGDCHSEIHSQWKNSMHHLAHHDPVYVALSQFLLRGLNDPEEIAESESCVKCHTPMGNITGYPLKTSDDREKVSTIAAHGIQCDYCHSATGAKKIENNGLILDPGHGEDNPGIKRGPFPIPSRIFMKTLILSSIPARKSAAPATMCPMSHLGPGLSQPMMNGRRGLLILPIHRKKLPARAATCSSGPGFRPQHPRSAPPTKVLPLMTAR